MELKGIEGGVSLSTLFLCDLDLFIKMGIIFVTEKKRSLVKLLSINGHNELVAMDL